MTEAGSRSVQAVYAALERAGCRPRGAEDHFRALCPAHDSDSPSLKIDKGDRWVLLSCKVGCTTESIVAALGLQLRDLALEQNPAGRPPPRVSAEERLARRFDGVNVAADDLLYALRVRFGASAHRATENSRCWAATCPVCRADQLVIVEDEHDPLDRCQERPDVRATCFGCGTTTGEIRVELGMT